MIRVEGITKFYQTNLGRYYVLRDTSFFIPPLAKVGVVGRNGAGKSTLMRLLAGIDMPNKGRIVREGLISWPLGLATGLQASMTGRENARFACRIQGLGFDEMSPVLEFIQSFSEIGRYFDEPVRTYSSGMKARLNFGIAMAFDFDCYLIDELTAVGDEGFRQKSRKVFEEKKSTAGFVLVSHSMDQLLNECQSGLLLHDGTAQYFESIEEAVGRYRALMGADEEEGGRRRKRKRRKADLEAQGSPERSEAAPERRRRRKKRAAGAEATAPASDATTMSPADETPTRRSSRRARKDGVTAAAKPKAESERRRRGARKSLAQEPEPQPAKGGMQRPAPSVGQAPFAPRIPRDALRALAAEPVAADDRLMSERLSSLLRGGPVRR